MLLSSHVFCFLCNYLCLPFYCSLDEQTRRRSPSPVRRNTIDWDHHTSGGKTPAYHRSNFFKISHSESERNAEMEAERDYKSVLSRSAYMEDLNDSINLKRKEFNRAASADLFETVTYLSRHSPSTNTEVAPYRSVNCRTLTNLHTDLCPRPNSVRCPLFKNAPLHHLVSVPTLLSNPVPTHPPLINLLSLLLCYALHHPLAHSLLLAYTTTPLLTSLSKTGLTLPHPWVVLTPLLNSVLPLLFALNLPLA